MSKMGRTVEAHPDADVCTDITCCQAYIDPAEAAANWGDSAQTYTEKIAQAVSSTDGQAILYDGAPIDAVFFSSAAGRTLSSVEVWGGSVPYLESVESPEGEEVPNYRTTVEVPAEEFRTTFLAQYPQADLSGEASEWFGETVPTSSGGVETMSVGGVTVKGTALRTLFGLRSASFTVEAEGDQVVFSVTGYGHGVGMSQYLSLIHMEDHILGEVGRQGAQLGEHMVEIRQLFSGGQSPEEEQIGRLLKAEPPLGHKAVDQVLDTDAPVDEPALHGYSLAVLDVVALDVADLGDAGHNARAVGVAEAPLNVDMLVIGGIDIVMLLEFPA